MAEPHRLAVRVYYEDTDFSGVVYHANYLRFFERARTEFLRDLGVAQADLRDEASGEPIAFVVRRMAIDFLRPARMDDLLTVETAVAALGGASLDLSQIISRDGIALITAEVKVALVANGRARRLPPQIAARLKPPVAAQGDGPIGLR